MTKRKPSLAQREAEERRRHQIARAEIDAEARRLAEAGARLKPLPGNSLLRGLINHYRGHLEEQRVVRLLNHEGRRPPWLLEARLASEEEDARGIDIVVSTADAGLLLLQVKCNPEAAEQFRRTHVIAALGVVVAWPEAADADVWAGAIRELDRLRDAARSAVIEGCSAATAPDEPPRGC